MHLQTGETIIGQAPALHSQRMTYVIHRKAGTYVAGSGTIEHKEAWLVGTMLQGVRHARAYRSQDEALQEAHRITGEIEL